MTSAQTQFKRYEWKYQVDEELIRRLRISLAPYARLDAFTTKAGPRGYLVRSTYFDSADLDFYAEKQDGLKRRKKLRLRIYPSVPSDRVWLEIKRRSCSIISKQRGSLRQNQVAPFLAGTLPLDDLAVPHDERAALARFRLLTEHLDLKPVVTIEYRREAFAGRDDPAVRITIDRDLRACEHDQPEAQCTGGHWQDIGGRAAILEFKFNHRLPKWMLRIVRQYQLNTRSISKYCHGIDCCSRLPLPRGNRIRVADAARQSSVKERFVEGSWKGAPPAKRGKSRMAVSVGESA